MKFPKFPKNIKQHMPFIGEINGKPEFLACFAEFGSNNWKIYRYNEEWGWVRLTNAPEEIIECNPSVEQNGNDIIYSWSYQTPTDMGSGIIQKINKENFVEILNKQPLNFSEYSKSQPIPYGIYHNSNFYTRNGVRDVIGAELVIHLQAYNEDTLIVTYIINNNKISALFDTNEEKLLCELKDKNGKYLYKPCCYKGEWFGVVTLKGNDTENRYIIPVNVEGELCR
jgi:hypothetical protein